jgi:hypothetical protein
MCLQIGIASRLSHPSDKLLEDYGDMPIHAIRYSCWFFAGIIGALMIPMAIIQVCRRFCTINVVQLDDSNTEFVYGTVRSARLMEEETAYCT